MNIKSEVHETLAFDRIYFTHFYYWLNQEFFDTSRDSSFVEIVSSLQWHLTQLLKITNFLMKMEDILDFLNSL